MSENNFGLTPLTETPINDAPAEPIIENEPPPKELDGDLKDDGLSFTDALDLKINGNPSDEFKEEEKDDDLKKDEDDSDDSKSEDLDSDDIPEGFNEKQGDKWKSLKAEKKEAEAKAVEWQEKYELAQENKGDSEIQEKYDALQKKYDEAQRELNVANVVESPEYKKLVGEPLDQMADALATMAKAYEIDPQALQDAIVSGDGDKIDELGEDMKRTDFHKLLTINTNYEALMGKHDELSANATAAYQEIKDSRSNESTIAQEAKIKEFNSESQNIMKSLGGHLELLGADVASDLAKKEPGSILEADTKDQAFAELAGHAFPAAMNKVVELNNENATLRKELASLKAAQPTLGGSGGASGASAYNPNLSMLEAVEQSVALNGF